MDIMVLICLVWGCGPSSGYASDELRQARKPDHTFLCQGFGCCTKTGMVIRGHILQ